MTLTEYSFRLQKGSSCLNVASSGLNRLAGITGGFAPPTPNVIHSLTRPRTSTFLNIESAVRTDGTAELQSAAPKSLNSEEYQHLVDELHSILKTIPTESPPGTEDIYGLDTSIMWGSADLQW